MNNVAYPMEFCSLVPQPRRFRHPAIASAAFAVTLLLFTFMEQLVRVDLEAPPEKIRPALPTVIMDKDTTIEVMPRTRPVPPEAEPAMPNFNEAWDNDVDFEGAVPPPAITPTMEGRREVAMDTSAMPIVRIAPQYPRRALSRGIEGYVDLVFDISPAGYPINIHVIGSDPAGMFDRAAESALKRWKYRPKQVDGKAVTQHGQSTRIRFDLDD